MPGCTVFYQAKVHEKDEHGEPGHRCRRHGGGIRMCTVKGCKSIRGKGRENKGKQGKTREGKTREGKTRENKGKQVMHCCVQ